MVEKLNKSAAVDLKVTSIRTKNPAFDLRDASWKTHGAKTIFYLSYPVSSSAIHTKYKQFLNKWKVKKRFLLCLLGHILSVAIDKLPNFLASPTLDDKPGPHHQCSIHLNCESVDVLETAYKDAVNGRPSARSVFIFFTFLKNILVRYKCDTQVLSWLCR